VAAEGGAAGQYVVEGFGQRRGRGHGDGRSRWDGHGRGHRQVDLRL
jgi:hypothetical protein